MLIDVTSDLHVDFWVDYKHPQAKQRKLIKTFVKHLLPDVPSDILLVAGDIGHHNQQNILLFNELRNTYKYVLWVSGNHDLYLISNKIVKSFERNSFNRLADMVELSNKIDGVIYLDGSTFTVNDITIGGCGMWYDDAYIDVIHSSMKSKSRFLWLDTMNDANLIYDPSKSDERIDWLEYCALQKTKLDRVYAGCDVIMSHVAPTFEHLPFQYQTVESTFYQFDGSKYLTGMDKKLWVFGHTHTKYFFTHSGGCNMVCNPVGYPFGDTSPTQLKHAKFATIDAGNIPTYEDVFANVT